MTAVELFKYYLTGRHFTVVTDHASLTWLRNFKEPEVVVARWITRLQPFDFKIVHTPGKHHSHADRLSHRASRPCKRDTCPECAPLLHQVTPEEDRVRMVTQSDPYYEHFDGYLELVEDDAGLFRYTSTREPTPEQEPVLPELLWYLGRHPKGEDDFELATVGTPDLPREPCVGASAVEIERLLNTDSRQASTQTEPVDSPSTELSSGETSENSTEDGLISIPNAVKPCYRVRAIGEAKKASPALQALIDLSNVEIAPEQEQDPNLWVVMDMLRATPERPAWEHVRAEGAEIKTLWSQYFSLKIRGVLLRRRKNQGSLDEWQPMAPQTIHSRIFQACHHHKLAAH